MLSELAVGHSYLPPASALHERKTVPGGLLGADYEVADGRYRFKKVYGGLNWNPELRSPLTAPGVDVKAGEYLLAVRGVDLKPPTEFYSLFENTADKSIEITVGPTPDGKGSRTVTVEPLANENALRNRDWVEGNLKKVHKATGGRVAYVYVPNTAGARPRLLQALLLPAVPTRTRSSLTSGSTAAARSPTTTSTICGGRSPPCGRRATATTSRRPAAPSSGPRSCSSTRRPARAATCCPGCSASTTRPAGRQADLGRTGRHPRLSGADGRRPRSPPRTWPSGREEALVVENEGVPPDVEVEQWPADVIAGNDPQLEKAIEIVLKELKENPPQRLQRPPFPVRVRK